MGRTRAQSAARVFLGAALSPGVQAATRWICVNARTRGAYALSGKDTGSSLLHWLAAGRPHGDDVERYAAAAGLLGVDDTLDGGAFLDWYRVVNDGYPFVDYASDEGRKADARLMAAYTARSGAPPPATPWSGTRRRLPPGRLRRDRPPQPHGPELLAGWLRVAAGFTDLREISTATIAFRTSPSGGARHPTDVAVGVGEWWGGDLAGAWWYDPLDHALVPSDWDLPRHAVRRDGAVLAITSHVKRGMWRYRDVRAFRPVLIDAGHLVETLLVAIASTGWHARWHPAPGMVEVAGQLDPVLGYVTATPTRQDTPPPVWPDPWVSPMAGDRGAADAGSPAPALASPPTFRTNPLLSLTPTPTGVRADNHLHGGGLAVTPAMIDALAYATPSSRRDRPTSPRELCSATGLDGDTLERLTAAGLLLEEEAGDRLWRTGRAWFTHDWFLSLLTHAEEAAGTRGRTAASTPRAAAPASDLPEALDGRRTCRAFTGEPLPPEAAGRVLVAAARRCEGVRVLLVLRYGIGGLGAGTYTLEGGRWRPSALATPTEEQVTAAAIGQPWAQGFAAVVWLVPGPDGAPGSWERALIECGRAAQRIALAVSGHPRAGVFQSPALLDYHLDGILASDRSPDGAYLVGVGVASDAPGRRPRRFRPSALYAAEAHDE